MSIERRRAIRCYFCNSLEDDTPWENCPKCGGSLARGTKFYLLAGIDVSREKYYGYYLDGGLTCLPCEPDGLLLWKAEEEEEEEEEQATVQPNRPGRTAEDIDELYRPKPEPRRFGGLLGWLLGE